MNSDAAEAIVSGRNYLVVEVAGQPANNARIIDFLGEVSFVAESNGQRHRVSGIGAHGLTGVRFYEKDDRHHGKDVRIWQIDSQPGGRFAACHTPAI